MPTIFRVMLTSVEIPLLLFVIVTATMLEAVFVLASLAYVNDLLENYTFWHPRARPAKVHPIWLAN